MAKNLANSPFWHLIPPSEGKDTFKLMLQTAGQQEKGLPPAEDKAADKDVHRPNGSEHDDDDSDAINNHFEVDYGSDSMDVGRENPSDKDRPKKRPLPFNSPFRTAREFGITEVTSTFLGLPELVDAEEIVPALRLDLKTATEVEVEIAIADGLSRLEEKYVFVFSKSIVLSILVHVNSFISKREQKIKLEF